MNITKDIQDLEARITTLVDTEAVFSDIADVNLRNLVGQNNQGIIDARRAVAYFAAKEANTARLDIRKLQDHLHTLVAGK